MEIDQSKKIDITEDFVVKKVKEYLLNKELEKGKWRDNNKIKAAKLHQQGVDIELINGSKNGQHFSIECKGESHAKKKITRTVVNKEIWLNALGQIITRMGVRDYKKKSKTIKINEAYRYGMGLYWVTAQTALRRIPKNVAKVLHLYIFSVNDYGEVKCFKPNEFGKKKYPNELFFE